MYRAFSGVGAVHVGGGVLEFYLFWRNECFYIEGHLIVHFVEEGLITPGMSQVYTSMATQRISSLVLFLMVSN
jgi:hypothetical protein